jgi:peptidyl-prolyl cis-trans isomerase D
MLTFIRRVVYSRVGLILTLGVLALIALAFAAGDVTGLRGPDQGLGGGEVASVGDAAIREDELRNRVQIAFNGVRQQNPAVDMATFVNGGGFDEVLTRTINGLALQEFAQDAGMAVSKQSVDGEIASIPAFQGLDGKFSQTAYDQVLQQQRITDKQVREDIVRDTLARQLIAPTIGSSQVPAQLALPYASLLLERRQGAIGYIPVAAVNAAAAPTDAEVQAFYTRQQARYRVPERRTLRYALIPASRFAEARPTPAEVAQAYRTQAARFAATEQRDLAQVILLDQSAANALAARVKAGTPLAAAARAAGLEASNFPNTAKAAYARASAPAAADAAFAAPSGAVVGPVRTPLGWAVVKVEAVRSIAGKTLEQATPELTAELTKTKVQQALGSARDKIDDAIGDGATFDEIVADAKVQPQTTRPLLATGIDPTAPGAQIDPLLARLMPAAFAAEPGDDPQLVQTAEDGSFAVVAVGQVAPAAPRSLAEIRDQVVRDLVTERGLAAARRVAADVVAKVGRGTPLSQALQGTGLRLPPPQPLNASRGQLAAQAQRGEVPPALQLMFSMAPKRAKLLEAPGRTGWYVVYLDAIQSGNAAGNAQLIASTRQGLGGVSGRELAEQFTNAVKQAVEVRRDEAAIARLRSELAGGAARP